MMTKKINWEEGISEAISFLIVLPFLFTVLLFIMGIMEIAVIDQKLQYVTYACTRAATVSENQTIANEKANEILAENFPEKRMGVENVGRETFIEISLTEPTGVWVKGNYITSTAHIKANFLIFGEQERTSSLTMMLERPAS